MAAFAATDVTVSSVYRERVGRMTHHIVDLTFGDGALTYATGGVPLPSLAKFGMMRELTFAQVEQPVGSGYKYAVDRTNHKLKIFTVAAAAAHTHDLKFIGGITATEAVAIDGGDTLGKNAATDRTIAGANSATKGGVVSAGAISAAALAELANGTAPAAVTVRVLMIGK